MAKVRMRDLIVLLPGITGSLLQKDGQDLWAISSSAVLSALRNWGNNLYDLKMIGDDPVIDDLGDGIRATALITGITIIPGYKKVDGYEAILSMLKNNFELVEPSINNERVKEIGLVRYYLENNEPANFFQFPYDWRRDNRYGASKLKQLIDSKLPLWRNRSGAKDAKVILIAHSMGGTISRYYLEVLEGWQNCKMLFTLGTPYRGSVEILNYLANGYKNYLPVLTDAVRSFTSSFQMLPIYPMVKYGTEYKRVEEVEGIPYVSVEKAREGRQIHLEIDDAVTKHRDEMQYLKQGYKIIPFLGTRQPTSQSASLTENPSLLLVNKDLPPEIDSLFTDGDGTVPRISAIPLELSSEHRETFLAEKHGSLQSNNVLLLDLCERLKQSQALGLETIRGAEVSFIAAQYPSISVDIDDAYLPDEEVILRAELINAGDNNGEIIATIKPIDPPGNTIKITFPIGQGRREVVVENLGTGIYHVEISAPNVGPSTPGTVHDIFEVVR